MPWRSLNTVGNETSLTGEAQEWARCEGGERGRSERLAVSERWPARPRREGAVLRDATPS
jgi:hypothetical protein